jgi:hypothetical protein
MFKIGQKVATALSIIIVASIVAPIVGLAKASLSQTELTLQNSANQALLIKPLEGNAFPLFSMKPGETITKELGLKNAVMGTEILLVMLNVTDACKPNTNCKPINCEMGLYTRNGRNIDIRVYNGDRLCTRYLRIAYQPTLRT